jgi:hypothetical protein
LGEARGEMKKGSKMKKTKDILHTQILEFNKSGVIVKRCCYTCEWANGYLCGHPKVYGQGRIIYDICDIPSWCPGFKVKKRLEVKDEI